ncbi:MAG: hypothetical protein MUE77_13125 [Sandarakinorhabdus sp.]|jgi:hypothetical protein|nr:hypothetical protein [Sandarakinorhabdus sp.]
MSIDQPCSFAPANGLTLLNSWRNPAADANADRQDFYIYKIEQYVSLILFYADIPFCHCAAASSRKGDLRCRSQ